MKFKSENNALIIFLEGRIDSASADAAGAEIEKIISENVHSDVIFDMDSLEYISSAGLRVILRTRKAEPTLKIINASAEVYEILDMTGFTEMLPVEKAMRKLCVDGCDIIGKGAKGTVYRYNGDTIVKVYKSVDNLEDIQNERRLAKRAFVLGIPTAISYDIVKVGDKFGSVFELLDAKSYSEMITSDEANKDKYIIEYAALLKKIHETEVSPDDMPDIKITIGKWLEAAKPYLPEENFKKLSLLVENVPDTTNMLHCDYHTNNVMYQGGEALLIDMDTLSHGHPVFELANVYITYVGFGEEDPSIVENFLGMPYETAKYIWAKFIREYLGTEDNTVIENAEKKIILLNYLRLLRHKVRRMTKEEAEASAIVNTCISKIDELLKAVDTLEF